MDTLDAFFETAVGYVWGMPLVIALCTAGLVFTFGLGGVVQLQGFRHAIDVIRGRFDDPDEPGEITHFQALTTALSATVGLGNIAGVAVAIHVGGPGATFWMIVVGLLGMATKFAECTLAVRYRRVDERGEVHGGPMHYIELGLGERWRPLALFFAFTCMSASFGAGNMFQTNQMAQILDTNFGLPPLLTGLVIAVLTAIVIIGGIKRIGHVTSRLVPIMGSLYVGGALLVIVMNLPAVPALLLGIVRDAFTGTAAVGGFAGIAVAEVIRNGVRRACFSNEAGLGSAPIAHSAATTDEPVREGVVALLEPFVDTVVICTMTALVILISGAWTQDANGVELTAIAFDTAIPGFGQLFVPVAVALFAYSTLLSWSYYGERCMDYLSNRSRVAVLAYKVVFCSLAFAGAAAARYQGEGLAVILNFSDVTLGLMVVPNLIAVMAMFPRLRASTITYFDRLRAGEFAADAVAAAHHRRDHGGINP